MIKLDPKYKDDPLYLAFLNDNIIEEKTMAEDITTPVQVNDNATPIKNPPNHFRQMGTDPKSAIANSPQKNPIKTGK